MRLSPAASPTPTAIAKGEADINLCPPGGEEGVKKLADLLGVEPKPLDESHGQHKPKSVAFIDEQICIGCTLCIQACPVDAIAGAAKQMHTIIASECTGCELCLAAVPGRLHQHGPGRRRPAALEVEVSAHPVNRYGHCDCPALPLGERLG